jgi:hypothetical protein
MALLKPRIYLKLGLLEGDKKRVEELAFAAEKWLG